MVDIRSLNDLKPTQVSFDEITPSGRKPVTYALTERRLERFSEGTLPNARLSDISTVSYKERGARTGNYNSNTFETREVEQVLTVELLEKIRDGKIPDATINLATADGGQTVQIVDGVLIFSTTELNIADGASYTSELFNTVTAPEGETSTVTVNNDPLFALADSNAGALSLKDNFTTQADQLFDPEVLPTLTASVFEGGAGTILSEADVATIAETASKKDPLVEETQIILGKIAQLNPGIGIDLGPYGTPIPPDNNKYDGADGIQGNCTTTSVKLTQIAMYNGDPEKVTGVITPEFLDELKTFNQNLAAQGPDAKADGQLTAGAKPVVDQQPAAAPATLRV